MAPRVQQQLLIQSLGIRTWKRGGGVKRAVLTVSVSVISIAMLREKWAEDEKCLRNVPLDIIRDMFGQPLMTVRTIASKKKKKKNGKCL